MGKLEYELLKTEEIKPNKCPKCKRYGGIDNDRGELRCIWNECHYKFIRKEKVIVDNKKKTIQKVIYYR